MMNINGNATTREAVCKGLSPPRYIRATAMPPRASAQNRRFHRSGSLSPARRSREATEAIADVLFDDSQSTDGRKRDHGA